VLHLHRRTLHSRCLAELSSFSGGGSCTIFNVNSSYNTTFNSNGGIVNKNKNKNKDKNKDKNKNNGADGDDNSNNTEVEAAEVASAHVIESRQNPVCEEVKRRSFLLKLIYNKILLFEFNNICDSMAPFKGREARGRTFCGFTMKFTVPSAGVPVTVALLALWMPDGFGDCHQAYHLGIRGDQSTIRGVRMYTCLQTLRNPWSSVQRRRRRHARDCCSVTVYILYNYRCDRPVLTLGLLEPISNIFSQVLRLWF
jgi:hypothetical protein